MKHIIFVKDMNDEHCVKLITEALSETRVDFEINLERQAMIVEGRNDIVHIAKIAIREAGYTVE
ncbi:MAG: heavy-metal-associated domain-containing protein [Erysipelothrix sp.]|nr:heavy-metal-associated domain-containing protein [Erysipelothrix sp.]